MNTNDNWSTALDKVFSELEKDIRPLSPGQKAEVYETLVDAFNQKLSKIKHRQAEIEFGQHVEGLYDINAHSEASFGRSEGPTWKP